MQINQQILVAHLVNGINPVILAVNGWISKKKLFTAEKSVFLVCLFSQLIDAVADSEENLDLP